MSSSQMPSNAVILTEDEKDLIDAMRTLKRLDQYKVIVYAQRLAGIVQPMYTQPLKPSVRVILRETEIDGYKYSLCIYATKE